MQAEGTRSAPLDKAFSVSTAGLASAALVLERIGWIGPCVVLLALAARLPFLLRADFALNDGGLFAAMSNDLFTNHFALPATTSYNGGDIPFAYPPLAFYLDGAIHGLTGLDMLVIARWLPLIENLAAALAFVGLAGAVLRTRGAVVVAGAIFVLLPRSYEWMIMGGGLTRSLGYALATTCVLLAIQVARAPSAWRTALCALLAGLALMAHLEEGLFALYSAVLALVCYGRDRRVVLACFTLGLGGVLVPAPWWVTVVEQHGPGPFLAASLTGGWSTPASVLAALGGFLAPASLPLSLVGGLAVVGAGLCVLRGDFFAPVWLVAIFLLTPRSGPSEAVMPVAFLASIGACELVWPAVAAVARERVGTRWLRSVFDQRHAAGAVAFAVALGITYVVSPTLPPHPHNLDSLPPSEQQTMEWIASHTAPDARFLVLSATRSWEADFVGEWFPLLANRQSVLTPQGSEWLPDKLYARKVCLFDGIRDVATWQNGIADLEAWASDRGVTFSDLYVSKADRGAVDSVDWSAMLSSAEQSGDYSVVLENPDVAVLHRVAPLPARWAESGEDVVADDCRSLADEGPEAMRTFQGSFGANAAAAWVSEHNAALPKSRSVTSLLARVVAPALR